MPKFIFPLAGVLKQREHAEEQKQRALAIVQQQMRESQDGLREVNQSMQASITDVRQNRLTGKLDLGFLAAHRRFLAALQRKGDGMAQKMALLQGKIDEAQKALAEAAKQRKILEKLRDKQQARWALEISRKESAEMDEVNTRLSAWQTMDEDVSAEEKSDVETILDRER